MRERLAAWTRAHPYLAGFLAAIGVYVTLTGPVAFPFMADDYGHLAAAARSSSLLADRFSAWLSRVPVWSVLASALFGSHVLERTWAPMYLAFAAHAASIALVARWLVRELGAPEDAPAPDPWIVGLAVAVSVLYPNFYEILYWPTCMPYAVGGLFLAGALYGRSSLARTLLAALAFLTYETFVLPALVLMLAPAVAGRRAAAGTRARLRMVVREGAPWLAAACVMLAARAVGARLVGGFEHQVDPTPAHVARQALVAAKQLFQIRFLGARMNVVATTAMLAGIAAGCAVLWRRWRWRWTPAALVLASFAATAVYWLLHYGAMRAVYGAQLALVAASAWLAIQVSRARVRTLVVAGSLVVVGAGFVAQTAGILRLKDHNAGVLAGREQRLRAAIEACASPCTLEYEPLDAGLAKDWVLHPDYWDSYLQWLAARYGPGKRIEFVAAAATTVATGHGGEPAH